MSKKSLNPLEHPPTASSSDDDEVETSSGEEDEGEEEDSSSEEEEDTKAPSSAVTTADLSKSGVKQALESDSGSETETESESESEKPLNPPGSGKSVAVTAPSAASAVKSKKKEAESSDVAKSVSKRPIEGSSKEPNPKRAKKATEDDKKIGEDTKKPAFQRLWSEEDEITVLQGMIDFKNEIGKSPYEDTNAYYEFIKKSISFEVSKNQFMDKIRGLKKKYMGKEKPSFTKPHDQKSYKLCKYIWGPEGMALESVVKSNGVAKKSQKTKKLDAVKQELVFEEDKKVMVHGGETEKPDWFENSFLVKSIAGFGLDEFTVKQRWMLVGEEKKKKVEEEFKTLQAREIEFVLQKTKFIHEVISMITEASKK